MHATRAEAAWLEGDVPKARAEARAAFELSERKGHAWFVGELAYWRWKAGDLGVKGVPRGPRPSTRANVAGLTRRQLDVLRLLAEGRTNPEIARGLACSPRTIEHHVSAILAKLEATHRTEAVQAAQRLGLLADDRTG